MAQLSTSMIFLVNLLIATALGTMQHGRGAKRNDTVVHRYEILPRSEHGLWQPEPDEAGIEIDALYPRLLPKGRQPFVKREADSLAKLLRDTWDLGFRKTFARSRHRSRSNSADLRLSPSTEQISYTGYGNDSVLSLAIYAYEMGCCGASGSAYGWLGFNLDLQHERSLQLGDLIEPANSKAFKSFAQRQLMAAVDTNSIYPGDSLAYEYDPVTTTRFSFDDSGLVLYYSRSGGGHGWDEQIYVPYTEVQFFRADFLNAVRRGKHY